MGDNSFGYGHFEEEAQAPQHTYDNSGFVGINSDPTGMEGESTSNPDGHSNPVYDNAGAASTSVLSGAGNESIATLELNQS